MIRLAIVFGALLGAGVMLVVSGMRRSPPRLDAALTRLAGTDAAAVAAPGAVQPWLRRQAQRLTGPGGLPIPRQDLALLGRSPERFIAEKIGAGLFGLCLPLLLSMLATVQGLSMPWTVPVAATLGFAAAGFFVPDATVRSTAAQRRADFRHALSAYFDFVRLAFAGGAGPSQALEQAPRYSDGWAFRRIAEAVEAAQHARLTPWQGLARLGAEIGVDELGDLADLADLAGNEGAKIVDAITAYTQQIRSRQLTEMRYDAESRTTSMTVPIATIGLAFITLLGFPQIYLLLTS
ncbi:type II secretion system F family protein [Actinomadura sp. 6K520]|uniref:type II secretion system F family protein n=1 Tax=Actinomadura sp. 6K520 TaxID=2530364 RepID=UPI0010465434|nr:type II secretion system F family protein [Actinomadura sp. 6K520]